MVVVLWDQLFLEDDNNREEYIINIIYNFYIEPMTKYKVYILE